MRAWPIWPRQRLGHGFSRSRVFQGDLLEGSGRGLGRPPSGKLHFQAFSRKVRPFRSPLVWRGLRRCPPGGSKGLLAASRPQLAMSWNPLEAFGQGFFRDFQDSSGLPPCELRAYLATPWNLLNVLAIFQIRGFQGPPDISKARVFLGWSRSHETFGPIWPCLGTYWKRLGQAGIFWRAPEAAWAGLFQGA